MVADLSVPACPHTLAIPLGEDIVAIYQDDPMDGSNRLVLCQEQLVSLCMMMGMVVNSMMG